jgi:cellulose synthase/poly-beta-1,6-N-acetylglucosamine synthase-like glycosyltransferase
MKGVTFSVIVMTFNRPEPLRRCLESLASQTLPSDQFEVVLVDASNVPVVDVVAEFSGPLRLVHLPGPNLGVDRSYPGGYREGERSSRKEGLNAVRHRSDQRLRDTTQAETADTDGLPIFKDIFQCLGGAGIELIH